MIYIANESQQKLGGGFSFLSNLIKGMPEPITDSYEEADTVFIASASMVKPEVAQKAKADRKKVVLRIDNFLKHTRNQGKGMSRMKTIAHTADVVIYQSEWARDFLSPYTSKTGPVILNGVDTKIFNSEGRVENPHPVYLYSRFNRDESKNWNVAAYHFMREHQRDQLVKLNIVGQFSQELVINNFDFYQDEIYKFWGIQPPEVMARVYKQSDYFLYTYFADACSNSLIEALLSGCEIPEYCSYYLSTGGAREIVSKFKQEGSEYFSLERMCQDYREVLGG